MTTNQEVLEFHAKELIKSLFNDTPLTTLQQKQYDMIMSSDNEVLKSIVESVLKYRSMLE